MSNKAGKILGGIVLVPFVLIALGVAYCEANKAYWDHQVRLMCEKDGGVTVYEKVELSPEEYKRNNGRNGVIDLSSVNSPLAIKYDYLWKATDTEIHASNPRVWKSEYITYRKSDNKLLAKMIIYSRSGGGIPNGISEDLGFSCANLGNIKLDVEKQVFSYKDKQLN